MSQSYIPLDLRRRVTAASDGLCSYCRTAVAIIGQSMEIDHIVPEARGGLTEASNLCLACTICNGYKSDRIEYEDPITGQVVALFHPMQQVWNEHFAWAEAGTRIVGLTPVGRATVEALKLNRAELVRARGRWVAVGWHPPGD